MKVNKYCTRISGDAIGNIKYIFWNLWKWDEWNPFKYLAKSLEFIFQWSSCYLHISIVKPEW